MEYVVYNNTQISENLEKLSSFYVPLYKTDKYVKAIKNSDYIVAAVNKDKVIGALRVITDNHRFALLIDFIVDESQRRKGIGKQIMDNTLNLLKKEKVSRINLNIDPKMVWLVDYYSKLGFVENNGVYMAYKWEN